MDITVVQGDIAAQPRRSKWRTAMFGSRSLVAAVGLVLVALSACGGDGSEPRSDAEPTDPISSTTAAPSEPPDETPGASDSADAAPESTECDLIVPRELPDGTAPGDHEEGENGAVVWRSSGSRVSGFRGDAATAILGPETFDSELAGWPDHQTAVVDGERRAVIPIGDDGVGQVAIVLVRDECPYAFYLEAGTPIADALDYAERI